MNRKELLDEWMRSKDVSPVEMGVLSNIPAQSIRGYLRGDYEITDFKWVILESAMKKFVKKELIISKVPNYIIQSLNNYDRTIIIKKKIKKKEKEFIEDLKKHGLNCRLYENGDNHYVIENKDRFPNSPCLLNGKVIID